MKKVCSMFLLVAVAALLIISVPVHASKMDVVTLSGKAKNAAEKDLATKFANDVNGVKEVKNRMTIE